MMDLWIGLVALSVLASLFMLLPLWRSRQTADALAQADRDDDYVRENTRIYRQRLAALTGEYADGMLDQPTFEAERAELSRQLLGDVEGHRRAPLGSARQGLWAIPVVAVLVIGGGLWSYQRYGNSDDLALYETAQHLKADPAADAADYIAAFEAHARQQPDNPDVWQTLFPLYRDQGRFLQAAHSLDELMRLKGRQPELLALAAQMQYFADDQTLTDHSRALLDDALAADAGNATAHSLLGLAAFRQGQYADAVEHWQIAAAGFRNESSVRAMQEGIRIARQKGGLSAAPKADASDSVSPDDAVAAQVQVSASLGARVPKDLGRKAMVFIVARDTARPDAPPLAVVRRPVSALPVTLTLDDSKAMAPSFTLSSADRVSISARISRTGTARPAPGDWVSHAQTVAVRGSGPVTLVIDHARP
ncbi:c-type cytochrome biogenesis protein CcmI [Larsenimonas rhizosphaerae]|uniref:C-type cytochrome biogenesis protein CcmI n=1 Tax=Larsenimonas rhizosphaerae TaxID=2944682 RepID=A0AA41ZDT7_9GAMM|nr:c-type cytochrome biogenesis protein CcmI [Larsenimonas rhizosphaerae]MCX2522706.1 c-type cytochrome biogenesis protein CcmI [Larsenimonas rhizosphaerae]